MISSVGAGCTSLTASSPGAPAPRRRLAGLGADITIGVSLEALDRVFLFREPAAEEMNRKGRRGVAGHRHRCNHPAVSVMPWMGNGAGDIRSGMEACSGVSIHLVRLWNAAARRAEETGMAGIAVRGLDDKVKARLREPSELCRRPHPAQPLFVPRQGLPRHEAGTGGEALY